MQSCPERTAYNNRISIVPLLLYMHITTIYDAKTHVKLQDFFRVAEKRQTTMCINQLPCFSPTSNFAQNQEPSRHFESVRKAYFTCLSIHFRHALPSFPKSFFVNSRSLFSASLPRVIDLSFSAYQFSIVSLISRTAGCS